VGHPRSFFLMSDVFRIVALHSSVNLMIFVVGKGLFLFRMSQKYLAYVGTCMASNRGMLT
jgi:hypothetical protein